MTRIVRSTYRYKRPPRRKKPVAIEVPEVVNVRDKKRVQRSGDRTADPAFRRSDDTTARGPEAVPANDDSWPERAPKSAIVTIRRKSRFGKAEDISVEEASGAGEHWLHGSSRLLLRTLTDRVLKRRRSQPTVMIWHRHLEHVCHCQRRCR